MRNLSSDEMKIINGGSSPPDSDVVVGVAPRPDNKLEILRGLFWTKPELTKPLLVDFLYTARLGIFDFQDAFWDEAETIQRVEMHPEVDLAENIIDPKLFELKDDSGDVVGHVLRFGIKGEGWQTAHLDLSSEVTPVL